jgi:hypothetical protein
MSAITQTRVEDAVANANDFLTTERGANLDGDFASTQVAERVTSVQERAQDLLEAFPYPGLDGLFVPLSQHNSSDYSEAVAVLPGYLVLVPSTLVEKGPAHFYPAVVSEDGLKTSELRLHVLKQPYKQQIRYGASMVLSAAGQSETKGVGDHGRKTNDGVEAEHFSTLLAAGSDQAVQTAWVNGQHVNHSWRQQPGNSVTAEVSSRLFGQDIPQTTITITREQVETGKAMLMWHEGMRNEQNVAETATRDNALVVIQGLGFEALRTANPKGVEDVKRILSV